MPVPTMCQYFVEGLFNVVTDSGFWRAKWLYKAKKSQGKCFD